MKKLSIILAILATSSLAVAQPQYKVEKLPNGVEITHVFQGNGKTPSPTSKVTVNYEGKLQNGTVFDSSYSRGKPISFRLDQVIECWTEGVQKMQVGGKVFLKCPAETAYGKRGAGDVVPPNATLTFQVELLDTN
jgi:FKBP-type peptidyl-prolyl cis-trans isomerase FkpA